MSYIFVAYKRMTTSGGCGRGCCSPTYHDSDFLCEDDVERDAVVELLTSCFVANKQTKMEHGSSYNYSDPWETKIFSDGKKMVADPDYYYDPSEDDIKRCEDYKEIIKEADGKAQKLLDEALSLEKERQNLIAAKKKKESEEMERAVYAALKAKFNEKNM